MSYMFYNTSGLVSEYKLIGLDKFDTSKVTNMSYMFYMFCYNSKQALDLNISNWNTSNVTDMSWMFNTTGHNANTFSLDLSNWDTSKVTNMENMFLDAVSESNAVWCVSIPQKTGTLTNEASKLYGSTSSVYAEPKTGKSFTFDSCNSNYKITYNLNGGTNSSNARTSYSLNTETFSLPKPTRTGYTFDGWYENSGLTGTKVTQIVKGSTGNKTYYAKWNVNTYIITYNLNGGTNPSGVTTSYNVETATFNLPTPTRGGYTFDGWYESSDLSGTKVTQITKGSTGNKTYYAKWTANNYAIKYNANGGFMRNSLSFSLNEETYPWENNNGIYRSSNYNVDSSTSIMTSNEFTLTETGEISFDWAVSSESKSYDYLYYTIYKNGTALSGTGTSTKIGGYKSSDTEDTLTYTTVTKTLEAGTYKIAFTYRKDSSQHKGLDRGYVKNIIISDYDESKAMDNSNFTVGQNNKLSKNKYVKLHYTFKGWSEDSNATTATYQDEGNLEELEKTVKQNDEINLYAIWEINKYNVNVVVQNGTVDTSSKQVPYNTNGTFNLTPNVEDAIGQVSCTNNHTGIVENNVLTVSNVSSDTTCTVKFVDTITTLYEDRTLIINEDGASARSSNIAKHGNIIKEYEAMSNSNSYIFNEYYSSGSYYVDSSWYNERGQITSVEIGQEISPISTAYWFYGLGNMEKVDFTNLDTSSVTDMSYMFLSAGSSATTFELVGLNNWDTSSVTNMRRMFYQAGYSATTFSLDLSNWDTSSVTDMDSMFWNAGYKATTWNIGDLSGWDTSSVTDMSFMFSHAGYSVTTFELVGLNSWDTSSVIDMWCMFRNAGYKATTWSIGNLSNWDTSSVTDMSDMFDYAGYSATTWNIGDLSNWDTSSVTDMSGMFSYAGNSATTFILDLTGWDTSKVRSMRGMFAVTGSSATTFELVGLNSWDTSSATDMDQMFDSAGKSATTWNIGDLSGWDTSKVTDMGGMFDSAGKSATTWNIGDLSGWDTSSVTDMGAMFRDAGKSATTWSIGNLSNWDTSSVTDMRGMFYNAGYKATTFILDLTGWDTSKVTSYVLSTNKEYEMFGNAGYSATTWSVTIPSTTGSLTNTTSKLYGSSSSVYAEPLSGKSFTLAS